jgi:pyruvate/2-oxoglutarate/acetoin dehydrogenase E1 component
VLFLEHKRLYGVKEETDGNEVAAIGRARVVREGTDVTLVSAMKGVPDCLAAAERLSEGGVDAEVIDLRTLRPLDRDCVLHSLARTNRLVVVEEGPLTGGWAGEILALAAEYGLHDIDEVWRLTTPEHPVPYSPPLEDAFLPSAESIAESVGARVGHRT